MKISSRKCLIKRKFKFGDYKNCLKATQLENKINQLQKIKLTQKFLEKTIKNVCTKNNKLILKTQQRFKSENLLLKN